jgi:two-component system cell cycle response regulator
VADERKKIIAVDDSRENLTILKETLKGAYEVYTCPSAAKMFALLEHILPDLILLDVDMPDMNGYETAKRLKDTVEYSQIPFMFLTFRDDIESEILGLELGAVDYIHKPFVSPLLLERIKKHITLMDYQKIAIISVATVSAMNHIREGFVLVDVDNNYLTSNPAMAKMLPGIAKLEKGQSIFLAKGWPEELNSIEHGSVEFSVTDESTRYLRASISPVFIGKKTFIGRIFLFTDITDNVNFLTEMQEAAYTDALTGLYNRKHFIELADADIKRAASIDQAIYIAMADIDYVNKINNTYGHTAGDMILKMAADIIRQTIRSYDLLGRYGGEKFIILLAISDEERVKEMAERIRENIERSCIDYEGDEIKITCCIGIAKLLKNDTLETAIQKADEALCLAKNSGRNQVRFHASSMYKEE